jgi:RNA ligase (TIGR02306 family)
MNNIATIETIHSIKDHPNADALDLAMIRGFQVVVKKDQFEHGQQVVFVWPDTISEPSEWNSFLDKNGSGKPIKIKSCKLRGQFSTGLVIPIDILKQPSFNYVNGEDVSLALGVKKYIKDDGSINKSNGEVKGNFPSGYISKTDEILAQSETEVYDEFLNEEIYVSLKIDGQSLTFIRDGEDIHVCSRNLSLKDGDNKFWNTVRKYDLIEKTKGLNIAIQGEQYGPSIQKNPIAVNEIKFAIFNIKDLDSGEYYCLDEMIKFCVDKKLPLVPIIDRHKEVKSFDYYQDFADKQKYKSNNPAEGIVVRPVIPKYSQILGRMLSVKFINRNYKD